MFRSTLQQAEEREQERVAERARARARYEAASKAGAEDAATLLQSWRKAERALEAARAVTLACILE